MPANCPNCGREIGRRERFCDGCGAFLDWDTGGSTDNQLIPQGAPQPDEQRAGVQLQIKADLIKVAPGSAESTAFTVKNLGTQVEEFRCAVTGPDWITAEPAVVSVFPGQEATGTVQAAPPRQPSAVAGIAPFRLTATSTVHASISSSAAGRVDVAPYHELADELVPTSSHGRGLTRHQITLDNRGNVPLRITLRTTDVADGLRVGIPVFTDVPPGQVVEVPVSVYGSRRWFGRPERKTFSIIAEAPKPLAATRLSGTRTVIPLFPAWVPVVAAAVVVAAVAGAVAIPKLIGNPQPITSQSTTPGNGGSTTPGNGGSTTPGNGGSTTPGGGQSTTPGGGGGGSTTPDNGGSTTPGNGGSVTPPPSTSLIVAAPSAKWTSFSPAGQLSTPVQANVNGCQTGAEAAGLGAVLALQQVRLEDGTQASEALETDPPSHPSASITGVYTIPATADGEVFRAEIGFCSGVTSGAQMRYAVLVGSSQQPEWKTLDTSTSQLTPIEVDLPPGTTQITLDIANASPAAYGDVVSGRPPRRGCERPFTLPPADGHPVGSELSGLPVRRSRWSAQAVSGGPASCAASRLSGAPLPAIVRRPGT